MKKTSFIFVFTQGTVLHRKNFVTVVLKCGITLNVKYPLCFWSWLQSKFMANKFLLFMSWQVPDCYMLVWEAQYFTQNIIWGPRGENLLKLLSDEKLFGWMWLHILQNLRQYRHLLTNILQRSVCCNMPWPLITLYFQCDLTIIITNSNRMHFFYLQWLIAHKYCNFTHLSFFQKYVSVSHEWQW